MAVIEDGRAAGDDRYGHESVADRSDRGADVLVLTDCDVTAVTRIRRWLRQRLRDSDHASDAELVATELVANAIDHGGGAAEVRLIVARDQMVRVEVDDREARASLTVGRSRLDRFRGNGLVMVNALASWGVARTRIGKTVWAELAPSATRS